MPCKLLCWIPVEPEEPEIYETKEHAHEALEHYELMQPENIYKVVRVEKD